MRCSRSVISCLYHAARTGLCVGLPRLILKEIGRCQRKVLRPYAFLSILACVTCTKVTTETNLPSIVATPIDATAKEQVMNDDKECTSSLLTTNHQSTSTCDVAPPEEIPLQEEVDNPERIIPTGEEKVIDGPPDSKRKKVEKSVRPNAFISMRIPSSTIREKIEEVQQKLRDAEPSLKSAMVSLKTLHITLMVLRLDSAEQEEKAKEVLAEVTKTVISDISIDDEPLTLEISGIGRFSNKGIFAKIKEGPAREKLYRIAALLRKHFSENGLPQIDDKPFESHLTIAKASKMKQGPKKLEIPESLYKEISTFEFGEQTVEGLELLAMNKPKDDDGYYHCFLRCSFIRNEECS